MCGRYVLALRYGQVHDVLEQHGLPANDFHSQQGTNDYDDRQQGHDSHDSSQAQVSEEETLDAEDKDGDSDFWPTYNFAPGYRGIVLRPADQEKDTNQLPRGKISKSSQKADQAVASSQSGLQLQVMKWGLVPSWTRTRPNHATMLKTINCRADSLMASTGLWAPLRGRKRCVVVAEGFYEWRKAGPKERVPHYIRRRDGLPLLFAGLWDVRKDESGETEYTYTIITTDSNAGLRFLHDRMPVVFQYDSDELRAWLDPKRDAWSAELQALLRPWPHTVDDKDDGAALLVDVVSKDVNKAGHSSASMVVPVASASNKSNIANFLQGPAKAPKRQADTNTAPEPAKRAKPTDTVSSLPPAKVTTDMTEATTHIRTSTTPRSAKPKEPAPARARAKGVIRNGAAARTPSKKGAAEESSQKITAFFGRGG